MRRSLALRLAGGVLARASHCLSSGFLASRSLIFSKWHGRQTCTSSPESCSELIQSHWSSETTPLSAFSSANRVPRYAWLMTKSGNPWLPVLGVIHLPGRICAGCVCITRQPCNFANVITAFWNSASDTSATVHQPINEL